MDITQHPLFIGIASATFVAFATYITYINTARLKIKTKSYKTQLEKFYYPVFLKIEDSLYTRLSEDDARDIANYLLMMCDKNKLYVSDRIIDRLRLMNKSLEENTPYHDHF